MKAEDVIRQLRFAIPNFTDFFSTKIEGSTITRSGTTVTVSTPTPHGLKVGKYVTITGVTTPVEVDTLTQVDGTATLTTLTPHDVTKNDGETFIPTVMVTGADQGEYNGTYDITSSAQCPNRKTIKFPVDDAAISPATTGSIILLFDGKDRGYNGRFEIDTVSSPTEFTYELDPSLTPISPGQGTITIHTELRISGSAKVEKLADAYTKQAKDDYWMFVVLDDVNASQDRKTDSDATATVASGEEFRQRIIQPFSVYVFAPAKSEAAARQIKDIMHSDVFKGVNQAVLRVRLPSQVCETQWSGITFKRHGTADYNDATYIHEYEFEQVANITYNDTSESPESVAFRDIMSNWMLNCDDEEVDMTLGVDLDDEPTD